MIGFVLTVRQLRQGACRVTWAADPVHDFVGAGGDILVAEADGHLAAMGGIRPTSGRTRRAEVCTSDSAAPRCGPSADGGMEARAALLGFREAWTPRPINPRRWPSTGVSATARPVVNPGRSGT